MQGARFLEEFIGDSTPDYAMLSHTWGEEEVIFPDLVDSDFARVRAKAGFVKVEGACALARNQEFDSAELSESINSLYRWYRDSIVCNAYLSDVHAGTETQLESSRWFQRGWTLQELIAPRKVNCSPFISRASQVDDVAKKMYWASRRRTTRREDEAYCLMGLFNKAFARLQQEIAKVTADQLILAWVL
ncbi:hypothetical protein N657DRAFT_654253 [Parathielavia appendiculata]|uniref:Heterokaryon incompatibility domain-containing protein n=1 Tax=Parathielavia appendiculata TaxID=2587402 RepID=A0AAN6U3T8_9PEZI|nr:hypothetical protein N657DRAFT_654253 [Parathielavia appendiculata]